MAKILIKCVQKKKQWNEIHPNYLERIINISEQECRNVYCCFYNYEQTKTYFCTKNEVTLDLVTNKMVKNYWYHNCRKVYM